MSRPFWLAFLLLPLSLSAKSPEPPAEASPMNEIAGRIQEIDEEARTIRVLTESGYNITFTYDRDTVIKGIGVPKVMSDLTYQELVIVRYPGKDLRAAEVEKRSLAAAR